MPYLDLNISYVFRPEALGICSGTVFLVCTICCLLLFARNCEEVLRVIEIFLLLICCSLALGYHFQLGTLFDMFYDISWVH
jgi:hypothetical protein